VTGVLRLLSLRGSHQLAHTPPLCTYHQGEHLTTAWVGDSRGVLGRINKSNSWEAVDLTSDHKPTNPGEKERILRSQGRVER